MDEGPTMSPTWHVMYNGLLDFVPSPSQIGGSTTKPGDHDTSKSHTLDLLLLTV